MNYRYFVGHRKPSFPIWKGFEYFELTQPPENASSITRLLADHRLLSEYAALFQLCRSLIDQCKGNEFITIAQYRRFVLNIPLGLKSSNLSWARVLSNEDMLDLSIAEEVLPSPGQSYLIGSGLSLPAGILGNYAGSHYTRDLLQFTSNLVDIELLTNAEAFHFLSQPILIPSPSCGTFPLNNFIKIMGKLETAAIAFFEHGYKPYEDPDQGRVCGALIERLNSYLLLKQLAEEGQNIHQVMGSTTVVSDSLEVPRGRMAKTVELDN
jgi:hypothetical protein